MIDKIGPGLKWMRTDHTVDCRIGKADEDARVLLRAGGTESVIWNVELTGKGAARS